MSAGRDPLLRRLERDTLATGAVLMLGAAALWPDLPGRALGVAGGVGLVAMAYLGIRAGVDAIWGRVEVPPPAESPARLPTAPAVRPDSPDGPPAFPARLPESPAAPPRSAVALPESQAALPPESARRASRTGFVKFFTRHAILAASAYVMIARFEFDPVAMLAGVTAPAVAGGVEIVRTVRARAKGPHSRFS